MTTKPSTHSFLFNEVAKLQGDMPWGSVLDAGTGKSSLEWILDLATTKWTAITGAEWMRQQILPSIAGRQREQDRLIIGNWQDANLLQAEQYDTVLADYLLGALDGFAPFWQDSLLPRLRPLVGKRLYFIGQQPYVPYFEANADSLLIGDIGRLRDACLLLARERPYREYPLDWVLLQLTKADFKVLEVRQYPIKYGASFVHSQLDMCVQRSANFNNPALAEEMRRHVEKLRKLALAHIELHGCIRHGSDYIIAAEPA